MENETNLTGNSQGNVPAGGMTMPQASDGYFMTELIGNVKKMKGQLGTAVILLVCLLAGVLILGAVTLVSVLGIQGDVSQANKNIAAMEDDLTSIDKALDNLADDVADIAEDNCSGNSGNSGYDPDYPYGVEKPNIYLYPETDDKPVVYLYGEDPLVQAQVKLTLNASDLTVAWPEADRTSGANEYIWDVYASEDGTVYDMEGNEYSYIFWEATDYGEHDFSQGFCVKGEDTAEFLRTTLSEIGLTPKEYNEFIVYWVPRMQDNAYNLISFEGLDPQDSYNTICPLSVTDAQGNAADSMLRVLMAWKPLDAPVEIEPQTFTAFEREGFTVVEWGGTEVH